MSAINNNFELIINILNNKSINIISIEFNIDYDNIIRQLEKILTLKYINVDHIKNRLISQNDKQFKSIYENLLISNIKYLFKGMQNEELLFDLHKIYDIEIQHEVNYSVNNIISEIEETANLNDEQLICYQNVKNNNNILITGSAGCGKSFLLKSIISYLKRNNKKFGVTSSTGISATLINGTTIHSFLKIGLATKPVNELYEKIKNNRFHYKKLQQLDTLIIDEISMINDKLFNKIAGYLSLIKKIKKPFGKIQLILCGDFYQLPPINGNYCFKSNIWHRLRLVTIQLKQQMRQINDTYFQYLLEQVKINNITDEIINKLSELRYNNFNDDIQPTILYSKNVDVSKINQDEFDKLIKRTNNNIYDFSIKYDKKNNKTKEFLKNNPIYQTKLKLCKGLQIMVTHNLNLSYNISNGTRGIITHINEERIKIKTLDDTEYNIRYIKYENNIEDDITFEYIPLKLAFAVTIHRSQGQTLDCIQINLGDDIFEYGMAYVALSRAKTLNSIYLSDLSKKAFKVHPDVIKFYNDI